MMNKETKPGEIKIGNVNIDLPVCLAPMAGVSTVAFRTICHEFGSAYAPTELVSARSILYGGVDRSYRYMEIDKAGEGVTCIQLFGFEAHDFEVAIEAICNDDRLSAVDIIDINMGCPVPKVTKTGAGCGLMRTPDIAIDIIEKSVNVAARYGKPVTVKTRIGFSEDDRVNGPEFARRLAASGAAAICVHGRTGNQMYRGHSDIAAIAAMRAAAKSENPTIPFFANGDIVDGESAKNVLSQTGADGIMIGRAARGNPWIFEEVREALTGSGSFRKPTIEDKKKMLIRELTMTAQHLPEGTAVKEMRASAAEYVRGIPGSAMLKNQLFAAETIDQVKTILEEE